MNTQRSIRILAGVVIALVPAVASGAPASAAQISVTVDHDYFFDPYPLTVNDADTVDQVKTAISTQSPNDFFTDICLVHNNVAMQAGHPISEYGVQSGDTINVYGLPMSKLGHWSITPDEPALGNTIGMTAISHPFATHVELIDGALPVGASLDSDTGTISGKFEELGPFSATFRATTICGDWDIDWSGTVYNRLPNTGANAAGMAGAAGAVAIALAAGVTLVTLRRQRASRAD